MRYIAVDPSGSFNEGKGHTGVSIVDDWNWDTLQIKSFAAKKYEHRHLYWRDIIYNIVKSNPDVVIIESFVVRSNGFLVGKMPETSLMIGALVWELEEIGIPYVIQSPSQAKTRFKDNLLPKYIPSMELKVVNDKFYFYLNGNMTNDHERDSLKHLLYYMKYGGVKNE